RPLDADRDAGKTAHERDFAVGWRRLRERAERGIELGLELRAIGVRSPFGGAVRGEVRDRDHPVAARGVKAELAASDMRAHAPAPAVGRRGIGEGLDAEAGEVTQCVRHDRLLGRELRRTRDVLPLTTAAAGAKEITGRDDAIW